MNTINNTVKFIDTLLTDEDAIGYPEMILPDGTVIPYGRTANERKR